MINYVDVTNENINKNNLNWQKISDHPYKVLIIGGSGSGKTIALLNLIKQQDDNYSIIDKIYLYVKDPFEAKYQYFTKKREK